MYDCFNMAYQDNTNALQLHIKINSENLTPVPQKYNAGSLRIPADPSWPKIPQRKLIDDVDGTIGTPCIVTLTGTPRRSRTVVQTPMNQSPKSTATKDSAYSSFHHQKTVSSMQTLKRLPGYVDPRFKKVTNVKKNQVTSTDSLQKKTNKLDNTTSMEHLHREATERLVAERNSNVYIRQTSMQEAEKPHEEQKVESIQTSTIDKETILKETHFTNNLELKKRDVSEGDKKNEFESKSVVNNAETQVDIASLPVQENNGQLFFVLDKKLHSHPLNTINVDTITVPQEYVNQCYNMQVPVLTYQNVAMQMPPAGTNNATQKCSHHSEHKNLNKSSPLIKKDSKQHVPSNKTQIGNKSLANDVEKVCCERKNTSIQSNIPDESRNSCFKSDLSASAIIPEKLQQKQQESSDSEYCVPITNKRNMYSNVLQRLKMKKFTCNTSGEETTDSEFVARKTVLKKEFTDANKLATKATKISADNVHGDIKNSGQSRGQINSLSKETEYLQSVPQSNITNQNQPVYQNYKTGICETKGRNKSEQNLPCVKSECTRKLCRNSEPYITFKQKKASTKFSRKAKSYFQKNSHSALVDSDYTLVWPNCQYNKHKRNLVNTHKLGNHAIKKLGQHFNPAPVHDQNTSAQIDNASNFVEQNYVQNNEHVHLCQEMTKSSSKTCLQREHCKCEISPRSNTDDACEKPKGISLKTQELLNKSYWEYYNKLRHKIKNTNSIEHQYPYHLTMDTLDKEKKGKASEAYDNELRSPLKVTPELQTLQQCTALSTMINKALDSDIVQTNQLYTNDNMKSPSNHKLDAKSASTKKIPQLGDEPPAVANARCNGDKRIDKQFLELKSIIFFGGMMYILIIFLPMLYDYFYYEEYDDYENLSYLELIVDYVLSSFKEAFGGVFNGVKQIFFYPVRL